MFEQLATRAAVLARERRAGKRLSLTAARSSRSRASTEIDELQAWLGRFPDLVAARGTNGNDLLGMATAIDDERLVALLLERGANPTRRNMHGWTALHQAAYAGLRVLAKLLLDAGAPVNVCARGDGGTPLVIALFWGHARTAELLADTGVLPLNLHTAAELERVDSPRRTGRAGWLSVTPGQSPSGLLVAVANVLLH